METRSANIPPGGKRVTGSEMRVARINRGKSIRALARDLDVPEQSIRRIEAGQRINLENAKKLADFHGVQVVDLLPPLDERAAA